MSMRPTDPIHPAWLDLLAPVSDHLVGVYEELERRAASGEVILPAPNDIPRVFRTDPRAVRVLLIGQDPYPTPGNAMGLSFSVSPGVAVPRSLANIYRELEDDLGIPPAATGDLSRWQDQGVMLLNQSLTVTAGAPASHSTIGWRAITDRAVIALAELHRRENQPLVGLLWGAFARTAAGPVLAARNVPCIQSPHPSPLSAARGFFGSRPFSRANALLEQQGAAPIDWQLA